MLDTYNKIWVDAITWQKASKEEGKSWKTLTLISISVLQGLNLLTFLFIIRAIFNHSMPVMLPVNIVDYRAINGFFSILFTFFVPFLILNYLLVFYNERYNLLLRTYNDQQGRLYRKYTLISIGVLVIPIALKFIF